jgi:predicted PurR-regulated permease PerM
MARTREAKQLRSLAFYGAVVLTAVLAYRIVQPFLVEITWAAVLVICLAPAQARLSRRLGGAPSAALLTLLVVLVLIVPLLLVAQLLVGEASQAIAYLEAHVTNGGGPAGLARVVWQWLHQRLPFLPNEEDMVRQLSERLGEFANLVAVHANYVVSQVLGFMFSASIMLCTLYFMLKDAPAMARGVRRILPFGRERNERLLELVYDIVSTSVTSTLVIALVQGILGGVMLLLLGVPGALLLAGSIVVLALLPAVGAALVWGPTAIWLALSGSIMKGAVLALFGLLVLSNVDNVVRPLMLSGTARLSTLVLIISLLGGISAFGLVGIVLGPVVAAVFSALVETYTQVLDEEPETRPAPPLESSPPARAAEGAQATPRDESRSSR